MQVLSMPNWYTIKTPTAAAVQAAADGSVVAATEVLIYKEIGDNWWSEDPITAARFRADVAAIQAPEITVRILSAGGSVPDGLGIYNALKNHPAKIITINDGLADSPESVNSDPYGSWFFKLKPSDASELDKLLDAAAYKATADSDA